MLFIISSFLFSSAHVSGAKIASLASLTIVAPNHGVMKFWTLFASRLALGVLKQVYDRWKALEIIFIWDVA